VADHTAQPTKALTQSDVTIFRQNPSPLPPPSPLKKPVAIRLVAPALNVSGTTRRLPTAREIALPGGFIVSKDTASKIQRFIKTIIANPTAHLFTKHKATALDPKTKPEDRKFVRFYARRISLVYCLVTEQGKRDRKKIGNAKQRGKTACMTINIRELVITMLYVFSSGYNENGTNIIAHDDRLSSLMPSPQTLPFYGVKPDVLTHVIENDPHVDRRDIISMSDYKESMSNVAIVKLRRIISAASDDAESVGRDKLIQLLNLSLIDFDMVAPPDPAED
jgi:hypothetical protein